LVGRGLAAPRFTGSNPPPDQVAVGSATAVPNAGRVTPREHLWPVPRFDRTWEAVGARTRSGSRSGNSWEPSCPGCFLRYTAHFTGISRRILPWFTPASMSERIFPGD
jgi:hypothetical protein